MSSGGAARPGWRARSLLQGPADCNSRGSPADVFRAIPSLSPRIGRPRKETRMPSTLTTGSNRGLGREWARLHAQEGWRVYATCRHPAEAAELHALAARHTALSVHRLDVTRHDEVQALAVELQHESIDLLVYNAGVYLEKSDERLIGRISYDDWIVKVRVGGVGGGRV